jgi:hypothetical protein
MKLVVFIIIYPFKDDRGSIHDITCRPTLESTQPMGTGVIFPGVKWPEHQAIHSFSRSEVKNACSYFHSPIRIYGTHLIKYRDKFTSLPLLIDVI